MTLRQVLREHKREFFIGAACGPLVFPILYLFAVIFEIISQLIR